MSTIKEIEKSPNKKTVLIIIGTFRTGGKERQISELVKGLVTQGYRVYFYSRNIVAHYFNTFKDLLSGYKNDEAESFSPKTIKSILGYIKEVNPDIIHSWSTETSFIVNTYNLVNLRKHKVIDGSIRDSFYFKTFSSGWVQRQFCNIMSHKIISNTRAGLKSYKCPKKKSTHVYNGISLERFSRAQAIPETEIQDGKIIVGMVATYSDKKDYKTFIEAGKTLLDDGYHVQFIGIGNKFQDFYTCFNDLIPEKHANSINLLGERSNVEDYIVRFDIGVLFTNPLHGSEGISNSIMEYMTAGKPVVATNLGGTPEIIQDAFNGFLVEPENVSQAVDKIKKLLDNESLRKEIGENAKQTILSQFTFEKMIEKFVGIYNSI